MKRINVLDAEVFNKIAAGEVVEKPASIVKELVENSLDAKATEILIEIENGGIDKIKVVDNGTGIHPDDVKTAFLPHSTSKIKTVEDLSEILTLGFRGEALASIASVSKVKLISKQSEFDLAKEITIEGGIVKDFTDVAKSNGTTVEISDLFYNIPARKKFLRKNKTEENEITNLVVRYILSNPQIKFTYVVDKSVVYKTNGTNLEDAIYIIYKISTDNLLKVDYKTDDIAITGYISKPNFSKSNRTYQTLIVNGRYVVNNLISTCVQNAYQNYLMKGQFPVYVLNFNLPYSSLDVNVHPNKLDVKFENTQRVYGYFFSSVSKALLNFEEIHRADENSIIKFKEPELINKTNQTSSFVGKSFSDTETKEDQKEEVDNSFDKNSLEKTDIINTYKSFSQNGSAFYESPIMSKMLEKAFTNNHTNETPNKVEEVNIFSNKINEVEQKEEIKTTKSEIFENISKLNYKIVGICFDTYILIELNNSLFVLDQHACHERLNYDKLVVELENKALTLQPLLIPYILDTNSLETNFLLNNLDALNELGFTINEFGENCFKISTVPSVLQSINLVEFFKEILSDLNSFKKILVKDILKEKLSQKACKASVRAGDKLKNEDIEILLNKMIESNMTLSCPHGRPAIIEITKNDLEKSFKRKI